MDASSVSVPPRLLVVDDQPAVLKVLVTGLGFLGLEVDLATSGPEAVALISRDPTAFSLALIDLNLPGMSGLETVAALQRVNPALRCCLMTGAEVVSENMLAGVARLFHKPFHLAELSRELLELAGGKG
jgi:CheY-like chemotaxis protein